MPKHDCPNHQVRVAFHGTELRTDAYLLLDWRWDGQDFAAVVRQRLPMQRNVHLRHCFEEFLGREVLPLAGIDHVGLKLTRQQLGGILVPGKHDDAFTDILADGRVGQRSDEELCEAPFDGQRADARSDVRVAVAFVDFCFRFGTDIRFEWHATTGAEHRVTGEQVLHGCFGISGLGPEDVHHASASVRRDCGNLDFNDLIHIVAAKFR
mmetsp:Transcript_8215/g.23620  ORF Transcript_8215/g.23620 Transcript_8215/m.23620 type:complete len:209 (+) Transcript_8215:1077-1703(+)